MTVRHLQPGFALHSLPSKPDVEGAAAVPSTVLPMIRSKKLHLSLLPALEAILNAKSLTEAADRAHLTQPAMSLALRKAREHFGDELIVFRSGRSELTELGTLLRPRVTAALQAARDALDCALDFDPKTSTRTVRIMANAYVEVVLLPPLLALLSQEAPLISVEVERFAPLPANPNLLENIDIVFASQHFALPEYSYQKLFSDRLTGLVWDNHPTIGSTMTMDQYEGARHATIVASNERSLAIFRRREAAGGRALHTPSAAALPHMIVGTDLVVTGMSRYCKAFTRDLPLRVVRLVGDKDTTKELNIEVGVLWKPHRSAEPFIKWLIDICQRAAKSV